MLSPFRMLWVDDNTISVNNWKPFFERYGCSIDLAKNGKEGLRKIQKISYSKILVDLEMPEMNGVEFVRHLERNHPLIPITFVSAHLDEPYWKTKLGSLSRTYSQIDVPFPLVTSPRFSEVVGRFFNGVRSISNSADLSFTPFSEVKKMNANQLSQFKQEILKQKAETLNEKLKDLNADWIVLCGNEVFMKGKNHQIYPNEKKLLTIAMKTNFFPILFFKTPVIEEVKWSSTYNADDFYPTLEVICFGKNSTTTKIKGDFDTGSDSTHFDFIEMNKCRIIKESIFDIWQESTHLGGTYSFIKKRIDIGLSTDKSITKKKLSCVFVQNWKGGVFQEINPKRQSLIGRDILKKFKLKIILDSSNKSTSILEN